MLRRRLASQPKHVRKGKILVAGDFAEGESKEKWDFVPLIHDSGDEATRLGDSALASDLETLISAWCLSGDERIRDRFASRLFEREATSAQKLFEANTLHKTKSDHLLDVPRWGGQRFIVREHARGSEVP